MPTLYVLAGPNGIGKTTSSYDLVPKNTPLINSDEIAKETRKAGHISVNTQEYSNREAIRLMEEQREQRNSFAIETNLADVDTWKFLLEVQKTGYNLHVKYLSTDDLEMLNTRITERFKQGEHYVNPEIVKERYINGLNLLNHYFNKPDILELFDNSKQMIRIAEINHGQILELADSVPEWITKYLGKHLQPGLKQEKPIKDMTFDEVRKTYQEEKK